MIGRVGAGVSTVAAVAVGTYQRLSVSWLALVVCLLLLLFLWLSEARGRRVTKR